MHTFTYTLHTVFAHSALSLTNWTYSFFPVGEACPASSPQPVLPVTAIVVGTVVPGFVLVTIVTVVLAVVLAIAAYRRWWGVINTSRLNPEVIP